MYGGTQNRNEVDVVEIKAPVDSPKAREKWAPQSTKPSERSRIVPHIDIQPPHSIGIYLSNAFKSAETSFRLEV